MKKDYNMDFCFKGNRTYIHGTDIYNRIEKYLKDENINYSTVDLSLHGVANKKIELLDSKPTNENLLKFAFKYTDLEDDKKVIYGIENNIEITCRYAYPEEDICKLSMVDVEKEEVVLIKNTSFSFIENSVAINKYLLENLFPNAQGKWYFTRLQLKQMPLNSLYPLKLTLKANFNFKLTKSEIMIADKSIGFIYFSLV